LTNKKINKIILRLLNYDDILRSIGKSKQVLEQCEESISYAVALPNGNIVSARTHTIKARDSNNLTILNTLDVEDVIIYLAALPDNNVVICLENGTIKVWNTEVYVYNEKLKEYNHLSGALLLSNSNIACIADDIDCRACFLILDSKNNYECLKVLDLTAKEWGWFDYLFPISNTMFSSYCYADSNPMIWNIGDGYQCLTILEEALCSISLIDNVLLIGGYDGINVFDTNNDFQHIDSLRGHNKDVISLTICSKEPAVIIGI
jgi:WD40 repeat protein